MSARAGSPFGIEGGVVDGDLDAGHAAGSQHGGKDGRQLVRGRSAGLAVVDSRHDRVVEHVGIHVNPETVRCTATSQMSESTLGGSLPATPVARSSRLESA